MTERNNVILIISNIYSSDLLVYKDEGWDTYLFPNVTNSSLTYSKLLEIISNRFGVPLNYVGLEYLGNYTEIKPCAEHNDEVRKYYYEIFKTEVNSGYFQKFNAIYWAGLNYRWKSIKELKKDSRCMKINGGLINKVEKLLTEKGYLNV